VNRRADCGSACFLQVAIDVLPVRLMIPGDVVKWTPELGPRVKV